jgi:hypothetical protein
MNLVIKLLTAGGYSFLLALVGCSSTPTTVDTGAIHATTFNFVGNGAMPTATYADNRQQMHALIQEAITKNLAPKGLTRAPGAGNVTVAYLVIVGNNASTAAINDYFGYGRDATELHDKAQDAYTSSKNPNYFEAGTLVIDLIDSQTYKLLKRSHVTRPVLRSASEDVRREHIQGAVDAALKDLRIAR